MSNDQEAKHDIDGLANSGFSNPRAGARRTGPCPNPGPVGSMRFSDRLLAGVNDNGSVTTVDGFIDETVTDDELGFSVDTERCNGECGANRCCRGACFNPFDPDCTNERLCEFWGIVCCPDDGLCTEDCPTPDPNCDDSDIVILPPDGDDVDEGGEGACCLFDGTCTALTSGECGAMVNASYQGDGSTCDDVTCAPAVPGRPTIAVCPAGFVFTVFDVEINAVLDSFIPNQGFGGDSGVCQYVREDGSGSPLNMWMVFGAPENVGCGQPGETFGSGALIWSRQRTIQVNGGAGLLVDWEGFALEFIRNGVSAGVGLPCP